MLSIEKRRRRNRAAALRYRERKKKERGMYLSLVEELVLKNENLKTQAGELEKEVSYLRKLLDELKKL